jgi:hypothetical protein
MKIEILFFLSIFQFQQLFRYCPQESSGGVFCIDIKAIESVVALGLYFLESGHQKEEIIVPYLLKLLKGLPKSVYKEEDPKLLEKRVDSK